MRKAGQTGSGLVDQEDIGGLCRAVADGDRDAFRRLYGLTSPRLFGIALRILRDRAKAADVLRQVFLEIWNAAAEFGAVDDPLVRLVARVRSLSLDLVRAEAVEGHALDPFETEDEVEDPLAREQRSEELKALLTCLGQLTQERRRMILHAYYDGWSREALSIYFHAPVHAVNTWVWRSIAELDAGLDA
ncbi:MAG: hypothetical protein B7Y70_10170 [Rhizobiales bacterium 35-68-8]|nr:MAG: hypothetical protein B7Y70_10170 [Rhizobiales bacterium 35-68-8]